MTNSEEQLNGQSPQRKPKSFRFGFSIGRKPPVDDPSFDELLEEARRQAGESPDGTGRTSRPVASLELADGILRVGNREGTMELDLNPEREAAVAYSDPFPTLTALRRWFHRTVVAVAIGLPIVFIGLGIGTQQTFETTFYMGFFGLFLSLMLVSSFLPQRTWLSSALESILTDAFRKQAGRRQPSQDVEEKAMVFVDEAQPVFTIKCQSCGTKFAPIPPTAICPHCSAPALTS